MGGVFLDRGWDRGLPEPQCLKAKRSWHRVQEEAGHPHIHTPSLTGWWQPQASSFWENTSHRTKHGQQTLQNVQKAQLWLCPHPGGASLSQQHLKSSYHCAIQHSPTSRPLTPSSPPDICRTTFWWLPPSCLTPAWAFALGERSQVLQNSLPDSGAFLSKPPAHFEKPHYKISHHEPATSAPSLLVLDALWLWVDHSRTRGLFTNLPLQWQHIPGLKSRVWTSSSFS